MKLRALGIFAGLLSLAASHPATAQNQCGLPLATLLRNFGAIAFGSEHTRVVRPRITKWVAPIRYTVRDAVGVESAVLRDLHRHMARLQRLTGHTVGRSPNRETANFEILFTRMRRFRAEIARNLTQPRGRLIRRLTRADCIGILHRNSESNAIVRAIAIIPVDHARARGVLYHCIVEETTQLMGLPNDFDDADFSIFNDRSRQDELGCQDEIYLRLLYDPIMPVGAPREQALTIARYLLNRKR